MSGRHCAFCGCSEADPCMLEHANGITAIPCSWILEAAPLAVCNAPRCVTWLMLLEQGAAAFLGLVPAAA